MTEEQALLRAICSDPDNDVPRLVYADWLDERARTLECATCGGGGLDYSRVNFEQNANTFICRSCNGERSVSDGKKERAEFIRLQIENFNNPGADTVREILRSRSDNCIAEAQTKLDLDYRIFELSKNSSPTWWSHIPGQWRSTVRSNQIETAEGWKFEIKRGFVYSVSCDQYAFTGICGGCEGSGRIRFHDGNGDPGYTPCPRCQMAIENASLNIGELFAGEPIQRVDLNVGVTLETQSEYETNLEHRMLARGYRHPIISDWTTREQRCWYSPNILVPALWKSNRISQGRRNETAIVFLSWKDAMDALSLAAVELGREKAGITLTGEQDE